MYTISSLGTRSVLTSMLALVLAGPAFAGIEPFSVFKARGGPFEPGTYSCRQQYNQAGYTYKVVELDSLTSYAWVSGGKQRGAMSYDSGSGKITFTSGVLAKGFEAHFGKRGDGAPIVILVDTDLAPKADAYDYCTRRVR